MLKESIEKALVDQLNFEIYSGYIYLAMGAWFEDQDLPGFANWMYIQWQEEFAHAQKFVHYVQERGGRVIYDAIPKPPEEWDSPLAVFEHALEHEQIVTGRINERLALARAENDFATETFLHWFVEEQVEEEASADGIIKQLRRVGDSGHGLLMMDRELGARTFTPPAGE